MGKRAREEREKAEKEKAEGGGEAKSGSALFTRRLQKSKLKELELKMRNAERGGENSFYKLKEEMGRVKKAVFTDERKLEQRKAGFERASNRLNIKKT